MNRRQRIVQDRARMAERALVSAGYLSGEETTEERKALDFRNLAAGFLADLLHLGEQRYGVEIKGTPERTDAATWRAEEIAQEAVKYFVEESR